MRGRQPPKCSNSCCPNPQRSGGGLFPLSLHGAVPWCSNPKCPCSQAEAGIVGWEAGMLFAVQVPLLSSECVRIDTSVSARQFTPRLWFGKCGAVQGRAFSKDVGKRAQKTRLSRCISWECPELAVDRTPHFTCQVHPESCSLQQKGRAGSFLQWAQGDLLWLLSLNFYAFPLAASTWCLLASESISWSQCWQQRPGVDSRTLWPALTARASLALAPFLPHSPHNFSAASQSFWDPSYNPWLLAAVTRVFLRMTFRDGFSHCPEVFLAFLAGLRADHDNDWNFPSPPFAAGQSDCCLPENLSTHERAQGHVERAERELCKTSRRECKQLPSWPQQCAGGEEPSVCRYRRTRRHLQKERGLK